MSNRTQIWLYLALLVAACSVLNVLAIRSGGMASPATVKWIIALMWAPAAAAVITRLIAGRGIGGLGGFGWLPWPPGQLAVGWVVPVVYSALAFIVIVLVGFGTFDLQGWSRAASQMGLDVGPWLGVAAFAAFGTLTGLVTATGEEIGWRGFLAPALGRETGFWRTNLISSAIWLLYHVPLLLFGGYSGEGTPLWYSLVCFAALIFIITPFMNAIRLRSGSFWPAALAHASHNLFIQAVMLSIFMPGPKANWLVGEFGAVTPIVALVVVGVYFLIAGVPKTAFEADAREARPQ